MKTSFFSRLSLICLPLLLSATMATAQKTLYSETPMVAKSGYWCLQTDSQDRDHTLVRFYNDQHQLMYEELLNGPCLAATLSPAAHRRVARTLGTALQQIQRMQSNSVVSVQLATLNRYTQRQLAMR